MILLASNVGNRPRGDVYWGEAETVGPTHRLHSRVPCAERLGDGGVYALRSPLDVSAGGGEACAMEVHAERAGAARRRALLNA